MVRKNNIIGIILLALVSIVVCSCSSDDNDGIVDVNFNEESVAGTWQVIRMDSVRSIGDAKGSGSKMETFSTDEYKNRFFVIGNGKYVLWENTADNVLDKGTYTLVRSSFRIDLANGTKINWKKRDGNTMILEIPNKYNESHRGRYTLMLKQ